MIRIYIEDILYYIRLNKLKVLGVLLLIVVIVTTSILTAPKKNKIEVIDPQPVDIYEKEVEVVLLEESKVEGVGKVDTSKLKEDLEKEKKSVGDLKVDVNSSNQISGQSKTLTENEMLKPTIDWSDKEISTGELNSVLKTLPILISREEGFNKPGLKMYATLVKPEDLELLKTKVHYYINDNGTLFISTELSILEGDKKQRLGLIVPIMYGDDARLKLARRIPYGNWVVIEKKTVGKEVGNSEGDVKKVK